MLPSMELNPQNNLFLLECPSPVGPILFLICINDFNNALNSGTQLLFADDANHYLSGYDILTLVRRIDNNLKLIHSWFHANNLRSVYLAGRR